MNKYTVVLLRPDYIADDYGLDTYVAQVEAEDTESAIDEARKEVYEADTRIGAGPYDPDDYAAQLVIEGHPKILDAVN